MSDVKQQAEGKKLDFQSHVAIKVEELLTEKLKQESAGLPQIIEIYTDEFSAVCPFSGLPDIARLWIRYRPMSNQILELKALKYYLMSFRNVGIYQEAATERIYTDLKTVLGIASDHIQIKMVYNRRGGMDVTSVKGEVKP